MSQTLWHQHSVQQTVKQLNTGLDKGLSAYQVQNLQKLYPNVLEEGKRQKPLAMLLSQFTDTMVLVLLGATVISGLVGNMADAITIMAIVVLNALLGFAQEYRAERSLDEINRMTSPYALVLREGQRRRIPAAELVPGDVVFLETGDKVPADLRLVTVSNLEIDEAPLTGESIPVSKKANIVLPGATPLADQVNMAFMGTAVTRGRGQAVAVETGMRTVMGQVAQMISETKPAPTPLQIKLDQLGKMLIIICLLVCAGVAFLGIYRGEDFITMLLTGISLAVAAIPEGLPAIVTVVLALGVQRMAKNHAIVRRLSAVETLGCTTVICSDKTGTLTQNKMTVKRVATLDRVLQVNGEGYTPKGEFTWNGQPFLPGADPALKQLLKAAYFCNNAYLDKLYGEDVIQGDPTEGALKVLALKAGLGDGKQVRIREYPFDSERKMMSVVISEEGALQVLTKGALDMLLPRCSRAMVNGRIVPLSKEKRDTLLKLQDDWAQEAMRVLGFAFRDISPMASQNDIDRDLESNLILVGICGIVDPPRPGVAYSVGQCVQAGIVPVMITGDHPLTARAIASQVGIGGNAVITGAEIDRMGDKELYAGAINARVFARVSPQHKHRIVKVLQARQQVVAMTGDGVNDAPALKAADIGVAMGMSGTDVSKEAAAMILADDDFSTIVTAVHEGRAIYDNIRKFIRYLLGCNIGEVLVMFLASLLAMPMPMLPIQILWVNLVTDGLPAMALGLEPPEPGIMSHRPRPRNESIFARRLGRIILARGSYIAIVTLLAFVAGMAAASWMNCQEPLILARSMALTTLVFAQLCYVFECRSERYSPFELGFLGNRFMAAAVSISISMHLLVLYVPALQAIFSTCPLNAWQWLFILALTGSKLLWSYVAYVYKRFMMPALLPAD
jgi:Ca2+-transporting ATPase